MSQSSSSALLFFCCSQREDAPRFGAYRGGPCVHAADGRAAHGGGFASNDFGECVAPIQTEQLMEAARAATQDHALLKVRGRDDGRRCIESHAQAPVEGYARTYRTTQRLLEKEISAALTQVNEIGPKNTTPEAAEKSVDGLITRLQTLKRKVRFRRPHELLTLASWWSTCRQRTSNWPSAQGG